MDQMYPRIAMKVAQHKILNLLNIQILILNSKFHRKLKVKL